MSVAKSSSSSSLEVRPSGEEQWSLGESKGSWMCQLDVSKRIERTKLGLEGKIQNM
jgi:hypothetical protein